MRIFTREQWKFSTTLLISAVVMMIVMAAGSAYGQGQFIPQVPKVNMPKPNTPRVTTPRVPLSENSHNKNRDAFRKPKADQNKAANTQNPKRPLSRQEMREAKRKQKETAELMEKESKKKTIEEQYESAKEPTDVIRIDHIKYKTADRVCLVGDFRKGNGDENTTPVVILHGLKSKKEDVLPLALKLAGEGMAVLTPDLRGHGESIRHIVQDYSLGDTPVDRLADDYTVDSFQKEDFQAMMQYDGQFWYSFLLSQHNAKHLNLRKLIVIGIQEGAALACAWVKNDWAVSNAKRGQFARGLVLISPNKECIPSLDAIRKERPGDLLSFIIFVGGLNEELTKTAKEIQEHAGGKEKPDTPPEERKVPVVSLKTEQQGIELMTGEAYNVQNLIDRFIKMRMEKLKSRDTQWQQIKKDEE